jgi:hypothetical protein
MHRSPLLAVSFLALATLLRAQTFIVDVAMGAGAHFPDIASAVAGVPDGATIEVRPGTYGNFTIDNKGLVVSGQPGAQVVAPILAVIVRNLPTTKSVTLRNLAFGSTGAPGAVSLQGCAGRVVVQSCSLVVPVPFTAPSIEAQWSNDVHLVDLSLLGSTVHPVSLLFSRAFLSGCVLTPVSNFSIGGILMGWSSCELTDTSITTLGMATMSGPIVLNSGACTVRLRGGTSLQTTLTSTSFPQPLVHAFAGGTLWLDPGVQLIHPTGPLFDPSIVVLTVAMPRVTALPATLGSAATATLTLPPGAIGGMWFGFAAAPIALPPFATPLLLDPGLMVPVSAGTATTLTSTLQLPLLPALRGAGLGWQGWSFDPTAGFQASNAVVFTAW